MLNSSPKLSHFQSSIVFLNMYEHVVFGVPKVILIGSMYGNIYLHLVDFYGKCRDIYHTWILWDIQSIDVHKIWTLVTSIACDQLAAAF